MTPVFTRSRNSASRAHGDQRLSKTIKVPAMLSTPQRVSRRAHAAALGGYLAVFLLAYAPALVVPYAFADDYAYLGDSLQGHLSQSEVALQIQWGRPTVGFLLQLAFGLMRDIGDLRYLRLVGVIGVALLAWLLYRALLAAGLARAWALVIPLIICAMPPFQVYVGFAETALNVFAALLGGVALLTADRALDTWQRTEHQRWLSLLLGLAAVGLVLLGLTLYPPATMVFWVFAAIRLFMVERSLVEVARRFVAYLVCMVIAFAGEYVLMKILALWVTFGHVSVTDFMHAVLSTQPSGDSRTAVVQDKLGKVIWFVREPLVNALNLGKLPPTARMALIVGVLIMFGLLLYMRGGPWTRLGKLAVALAIVPLSYAPNLLAAENWASYRTEAGLTALVALYACLAFLGSMRAAEARLKLDSRRLCTATLLVGAAASVVLAGVTVTREFVIPQYVEYQYMVGRVRAAIRATTGTIYVIPACWCDSIAPVVIYDEFGLPSTAQPWVPQPMVYDILHEIAPAKIGLRVVLVNGTEPASAYRGGYVIDMRKLNALKATSQGVFY
jgi:hypothetical protein